MERTIRFIVICFVVSLVATGNQLPAAEEIVYDFVASGETEQAAVEEEKQEEEEKDSALFQQCRVTGERKQTSRSA